MKNLTNLLLIVLGIALMYVGVIEHNPAVSMFFFFVGAIDFLFGALLLIKSYSEIDN